MKLLFNITVLLFEHNEIYVYTVNDVRNFSTKKKAKPATLSNQLILFSYTAVAFLAASRFEVIFLVYSFFYSMKMLGLSFIYPYLNKFIVL